MKAIKHVCDYQLLMMKPADCIPKIKSLSKLQLLHAEKAILNRAPVEEDKYRIFIGQFAVDIQSLVVGCPRCKLPFNS
jgi:hypothetical protein